MLRGTIVKVNDKCKAPHLIGTMAIVIGRSKCDKRYIKVHQKTNEGFIVDIAYLENELDVVESPVEI